MIEGQFRNRLPINLQAHDSVATAIFARYNPSLSQLDILWGATEEDPSDSCGGQIQCTEARWSVLVDSSFLIQPTLGEIWATHNVTGGGDVYPKFEAFEAFLRNICSHSFDSSATSGTATPNVFWRMMIEKSNECSSGSLSDLMLHEYMIFLRIRGSQGVVRFPTTDSSPVKIEPQREEIDDVRNEIDDLLRAMGRGEPLNRSDEIMELCGRLATQLAEHTEGDDTKRWSGKLAADLSKLTD